MGRERLKAKDEDGSINSGKKNEGVSQNFETSLIVHEGGDIYILPGPDGERVSPPHLCLFFLASLGFTDASLRGGSCGEGDNKGQSVFSFLSSP